MKQKEKESQLEKKNGHKLKSNLPAKQAQEFMEMFGAHGNGARESQIARLIDSPLQMIQRQTLAQELGQLQGNEHLQRVIGKDFYNDSRTILQRNKLTDAAQEQWKKDWNDPDLAAYQKFFKGEGRPKGSKEKRYYVLCPLYFRQGIERPLVYVRDQIVTAHFFQFSTPAHKDLDAALTKAEKNLKKKGYTELPAKSAWAFNPRTTSEGKWSNHATGKAMDIDPDQNPRLTNKHNRDVISAMTGVDMQKSNLGYDTLKNASDTFKSRYNAAGLQQRMDELQSREDALSKKQEELETRSNAASGAGKDKAASSKETQKKELKENKKELKAVQKSYELLEKELQKYEKEQQTYEKVGTSLSDIETEIARLKSSIKAVKDQIKKVTGDKRKQLKDSLKSNQSQLKDLEKKRKKLDEQKHDYTLRDYAQNGFVNLKKDIVEALQDEGLFWGGNWGSPSAKDIMHFQVK
jgi:hypothetical protein